ncbi:Ctf8-domain-containing protein [Cladorrhinum samala]|uniref:Ctf8-domain-containing protein n=1 Tax=Cladorrhinum samala TaxID=585594 RepID=A0AAV9HIQ0_9PEZI|nr:Ctf8-domain-containing protein [Cladorrhinum samala]
MSSEAVITIYPPASSRGGSENPFPQLIQTPSGLALLELQGTINLPEDSQEIQIGRLEFPDYKPGLKGEDDKGWMKRVWMWVGRYQRLQGEVKKLPQAVAVVKRRGEGGMEEEQAERSTVEDLEVVEIVKYKIVFSHRPEPVTTGGDIGLQQEAGAVMDLDQ